MWEFQCIGGYAMSYYFVAQIKINDEIEYQKYLDGTDEVFAKFNGKYLAVDANPQVLEGSWSHGRVVIIQFPTKEDLLTWYNSPEYQVIVKHRLKAAECDTLVVKGLD